jgi:hypothetical protein
LRLRLVVRIGRLVIVIGIGLKIIVVGLFNLRNLCPELHISVAATLQVLISVRELTVIYIFAKTLLIEFTLHGLVVVLYFGLNLRNLVRQRVRKITQFFYPVRKMAGLVQRTITIFEMTTDLSFIFPWI